MAMALTSPQGYQQITCLRKRILRCQLGCQHFYVICMQQVAEPFLFDPKAARRPAAEAKAIAQAVEMIEEAQNPLLLVGAGANRKRTSNMLEQFVELTGIPFICTPMGKGVIAEYVHRESDRNRGPYVYVNCVALSDDLIESILEDE